MCVINSQMNGFVFALADEGHLDAIGGGAWGFPPLLIMAAAALQKLTHVGAQLQMHVDVWCKQIHLINTEICKI